MSENEELNEQPNTEPEETAPVTAEETAPHPMKKGKYGWVGYILLLAVIALGVYLIFHVVAGMGDDVKSFDEVIKASDWRFALVSLAVLVAVFVCLWFEYAVVMKTTTGRFRLRT